MYMHAQQFLYLYISMFLIVNVKKKSLKWNCETKNSFHCNFMQLCTLHVKMTNDSMLERLHTSSTTAF